MVRSQCHTTNTQRCSDFDAATSKLRCSTVALTLDRKFKSLRTMNVVLTTLLQHWNHDFIFTMLSQRRYYKVKFTALSQIFLSVDSKLPYSIHFMATSIQRWNRECKLTTFSWCRYYDIAPTLCQLYDERQGWVIHGLMLTFSQPCY